MKIKFPKKRSDGSFCVEITLRVSTNDAKELATRMTSWLDERTQEKRNWKWFGETLDFLSDFTGPPTCVERTSDCLSLRLEGRSDSTRWWKDWIVVRLLKDLQGEFREFTAVDSIANCPER